MPWSQDNTFADSDDAINRTCTGRCGDQETTVPCPPGTDPFVKCDPSGMRPPRVICVPRGELPPILDEDDEEE